MRICTITKIRERQTKSKNLLVSSMEYLVWNSNDFSSKCSNDLDVKMKLMKVFEFLTDFESVVEYDPMKYLDIHRHKLFLKLLLVHHNSNQELSIH